MFERSKTRNGGKGSSSSSDESLPTSTEGSSSSEEGRVGGRGKGRGRGRGKGKPGRGGGRGRGGGLSSSREESSSSNEGRGSGGRGRGGGRGGGRFGNNQNAVAVQDPQDVVFGEQIQDQGQFHASIGEPNNYWKVSSDQVMIFGSIIAILLLLNIVCLFMQHKARRGAQSKGYQHINTRCIDSNSEVSDEP
eukprot:518727_1